MTRRSWVYVGGVAYEYGTQPRSEAHHVMPDIEPFQSPDGAYISGRVAWREHLKRTDSIEMGHSDIARQQENWNKRKDAHAEKMRNAPQGTVTDAPKEIRPVERSRLQVEILNRLHGKAAPDRKELIKLTLDQSRRMNTRG